MTMPSAREAVEGMEPRVEGLAIASMNPEWRNLFDPATGEIAPGPADTAREKR